MNLESIAKTFLTTTAPDKATGEARASDPKLVAAISAALTPAVKVLEKHEKDEKVTVAVEGFLATSGISPREIADYLAKSKSKSKTKQAKHPIYDKGEDSIKAFIAAVDADLKAGKSVTEALASAGKKFQLTGASAVTEQLYRNLKRKFA